MKKVLAVVIAIFPYVFPVVLFLFTKDAFSALFYVLAAWVIGLICAIALFVLSGRNKDSARQTAFLSMVIKLVQIPAYVFYFIVGMGGVAFIHFAFLILFAWAMDALTILLSGIVGVSAVRRCRDEGLLTRTEFIIHGILQFVFCADVVSAVLVYRKARRISK